MFRRRTGLRPECRRARRGVLVARRVLWWRSMPEDFRQSLGKLGEDLACAELSRRGYAILARRYRTRFGEIDIIARDGATVVFIEVKTRDGDRFGAGAETVTGREQRRDANTAGGCPAPRPLGQSACGPDVPPREP